MSSALRKPASSDNREIVPLTVEQYHGMLAAGILAEGTRQERFRLAAETIRHLILAQALLVSAISPASMADFGFSL